MNCPVCSLLMHDCGHGISHCRNDGTMTIGLAIYVPRLVYACRQYETRLDDGRCSAARQWHELGIGGSLYPAQEAAT